MPQSFTSRPVRGALQVEAIEPTSTHIFRDRRSIHFQDGTLATIPSTPRGSTSESGQGFRSPTAKLVICASG